MRAAHLAGAGGQVRCGYCGRQFDALQRLRDEPLPVLPEASAPAVAVSPPTPQAAPAPQAYGAPPVAEAEEEAPPQDADDDILLPELQEEPSGAPARSRAWWAFALVLLVLLAAGQAAWFQRDRLLTRFPQLTPWVQRLCAELGCQVVRHRDLASMRIVNRDVRLHPLYEHSLLVNATISNGAEHMQPWPDVQLALYDTSGRAVAYRRFAPPEYLDTTVDVQRGMRPSESAHFVLEVTGAAERAVSFEFGFL